MEKETKGQRGRRWARRIWHFRSQGRREYQEKGPVSHMECFQEVKYNDDWKVSARFVHVEVIGGPIKSRFCSVVGLEAMLYWMEEHMDSEEMGTAM